MKRSIKYLGVAAVVVALSFGTSAATIWALGDSGHKVDSSESSNTAPQSIMSELDEAGFTQASYNPAAISGTIGGAPDLVPASESSVKAVVHIKNEQTQSTQAGMIDPFEFFFGGGAGRMQPQPVVGYGSGVIISSDGYIMTNNHVIDNSDKLTVTLYDNRTFQAKLIGSDPNTDIALIKIEAKDLPTLPFGDSDKLRVGEWVLAVGNPFNLTSTVTAGIVSAKSRTTPRQTGNSLSIESFIQTDAAVNPGNSGGALVNAEGKLVGINTMIFSQTGNYAGYSFAVPINIAAKVVADIKKFGAVQRALLGISATDVTSELVEKEKLKVNSGVYVADFSEISAAVAAGMEKGDVIVAIDGNPIKDFGNLTEQLAKHRPGDVVNVTVNRKGKELTLSATLKNSQGGQSVLKRDKLTDNKLGAKLKEIDLDKLRGYGLSYGLEVEGLSSGRLSKAGVKKGFIILTANRVPLRKEADLNKVITQLERLPKEGRVLYLRGFYPTTGDVVDYEIDMSK